MLSAEYSTDECPSEVSGRLARAVSAERWAIRLKHDAHVLLSNRGSGEAPCANVLADDEDLVRMLAEAGWNVVAADLAISLLPIVFGRLALFELGAKFPDEFQAKDSKGKWIVYRLSENEVFREAARLAAAVSVHGALSREEFSAIAGRSPEVGVASQALHAGASLAPCVAPTLPVLRFVSAGARSWAAPDR